MKNFLGPHGKATIVLMRTHFESELPKLKDLKKILHIPDGKYYRSSGRNSYEINRLERLLVILGEIKGEKRDWQKTSSTDFLVTVAEVYSNLFMTLKYTAQVLDGFNLTEASLEEMEKLIVNYNYISAIRKEKDQMWETLKRNSERSAEKGIDDSTILNPDIPALQKILNSYGDQEYEKASNDIKDWYETYRWKYKSSSKANSSDEDEAAETTSAT